jgi:hypothetical protein
MVLALLLCASARAAEEPALPAGLPGAEQPTKQDGREPALPSGLDGAAEDAEEPALPSGLDGESPSAPAPAEPPRSTWLDTMDELGLSGFWEVRGGVRTQHDPYQKDASLGETRLQLEWTRIVEGITFTVRGDLVYDAVLDQHSNVNFHTGSGWLDLREASALFSPLEFLDVKLGRQILTWGTGDLLFLNDLFPKDWRAFFIGRDVEYLKAPSDAIKLSAFFDVVNVDFVYVPQFDPDRFVTGRRLSYYASTLGRRAGQDAVTQTDRPGECFDDAEYHLRLHRRFGSIELAGYGYWGGWKSPGGFDSAANRATHPRLNVYGASARGPLGGGIANVEAAYYDSHDDRGGTHPFVDNSQIRLLTGWQRDLPEITNDLSIGLQYYVEIMRNYDAYRAALPVGMPAADQDRHLLTLRVTKKLLHQNLILGLFGYYSPTDQDAYLRPNVQYKIDDHWTAELGGNVFLGEYDHTFFGQFERNSNLYASLRFGF